MAKALDGRGLDVYYRELALDKKIPGDDRSVSMPQSLAAICTALEVVLRWVFQVRRWEILSGLKADG